MPRITTRRLMALVALAACLSGLWACGRRCTERAAHRRAEAGRHQYLAACWAELAKMWPGRPNDSEGTWSTEGGGTTYLGISWDWHLTPGEGPEDVLREWGGVKRDCLARAAHHERVRLDWERAACRPWAGEPVEPPRPPIRSPRFRVIAE